MFWGPGVFGYGTALLWGSYSKDQPIEGVLQHRRRSRVRRPSAASPIRRSRRALSGFSAAHANIWVQYAGSTKWEQAPMEPQSGGADFGFLLVRRAGRCAVLRGSGRHQVRYV